MEFSKLPWDIHKEILGYLHLPQLTALSRSCRGLRLVYRDPWFSMVKARTRDASYLHIRRCADISGYLALVLRHVIQPEYIQGIVATGHPSFGLPASENPLAGADRQYPWDRETQKLLAKAISQCESIPNRERPSLFEHIVLGAHYASMALLLTLLPNLRVLELPEYMSFWPDCFMDHIFKHALQTPSDQPMSRLPLSRLLILNMYLYEGLPRSNDYVLLLGLPSLKRALLHSDVLTGRSAWPPGCTRPVCPEVYVSEEYYSSVEKISRFAAMWDADCKIRNMEYDPFNDEWEVCHVKKGVERYGLAIWCVSAGPEALLQAIPAVLPPVRRQDLSNWRVLAEDLAEELES